jgi:hypothetical protein
MYPALRLHDVVAQCNQDFRSVRTTTSMVVHDCASNFADGASPAPSARAVSMAAERYQSGNWNVG